MSRIRRLGIASVWAVLAAAAAARAQQVTPRAGYVYPGGGQQGSTFEVTLGGQFLDGVDRVYVSGAGIQASVVRHVKLLTPGQVNQLRDQLKELTEKRQAGKGTPEDEQRLAELRAKIATFIRPANPALAELVILRVTVAPDAAPGPRELRLGTPAGLTAPLLFCVGQLPEISKQPSKVLPQLGPVGAPGPRGQFSRPAGPPPVIALPAVLNGQILPGAVDRYRFQAVKGQRLVAAAAARELIPYISDAVPGWFQATLALYDAQGKEVGYDDDFRFHPDPVLYYEVPADGEYTLEIKDAIYRGREDFVYRITIGEVPFLTGVYPLGGKAGSRVKVAFQGWNLPVSNATENLRGQAAGVYPVSARGRGPVTNSMPFAVDTLAEREEREPNDAPKNATGLKLPVIVNGRIGRPGDVDVFRVKGRAGEEIAAEVFARRLESPLDSLLRLTDAAGRQLAVNDDFEDKGAGLLTHQADSRISFRLPKNGTYYLYLSDAQHKGGQEYSYRLRVGRAQPDFELRVTPSSVNARGGMAVPITVYALRRGGFTGDIALELKDTPKGFALSGAWVPAQREQVRLTLTVPPTRLENPFELRLEGRATVQGREIRRMAVPADERMQAFAYQHLVSSEEWLVRVLSPARVRVPWKIVNDRPVKLPAGGTAAVRVYLPAVRYTDQVQLVLSEPPEGIAIQKVSTAPDGVDILLRADAAKVKPGLKDNLIVEAFVVRAVSTGSGTPQTTRRRLPLGLLPAIPFETVAK